jgi:hypothetical protein
MKVWNWTEDGTKILGSAAAIVAGIVVIPDLIPLAHLPYWKAANVALGVLTVQRGYTNTRNTP